MTMNTQSQRDDTELLHRLLDEAFAPYPVTPETLDLKQEVRGNLTARTSELVADGATSADAARRALAELGEVGILIGETAVETSETTESWVAAQRRNRVRPNPAFAVRAAILAAVLAIDVLLLVLQFAGVLWPDALWQAVQIIVAILIIGWLVFDGLRQETTTNFPLSRARAFGFGGAAAILTAGLGAALQLATGPNTAWVLIAGGAAAVAIALFTFLGVTATNRTKPWAVRLQSSSPEVGDRFEKDPAAAARFGLYTVIIWVVGITAFIVLTVTVGWAWSWLAIVATFVVFFLVLARMLFGPDHTRPAKP